MPQAAAKTRREDGRARTLLRERIEARREEIEAGALARVRAIADPGEVTDPAYVESLRRAVAAAVGFGLTSIEAGEGHDPPIPVELLAQARLAARSGVGLDTVLRRYFAGYSLLGYAQVEEASKDALIGGAELKRLIAAQARTLDRLVAAIGEEHGREAKARARRGSSERSRAERIERLLAGEVVEVATIPYEFDGWHVGVALAGPPGARQELRERAAALDYRLLLLTREKGTLWAWLGARRKPDPTRLQDALAPLADASQAALGLGEPDRGLDGWRLTHRQAEAALSLAQRSGRAVLRYAEVALLAAILKDDLLATSLRRIYLVPLERERDGGEALREALCAYFAAGRNVSSAAAAVGLSRRTVANRLRSAEERIGRPLGECAGDLEAALRLRELGDLPGEGESRPE